MVVKNIERSFFPFLIFVKGTKIMARKEFFFPLHPERKE